DEAAVAGRVGFHSGLPECAPRVRRIVLESGVGVATRPTLAVLVHEEGSGLRPRRPRGAPTRPHRDDAQPARHRGGGAEVDQQRVTLGSGRCVWSHAIDLLWLWARRSSPPSAPETVSI